MHRIKSFYSQTFSSCEKIQFCGKSGWIGSYVFFFACKPALKNMGRSFVGPFRTPQSGADPPPPPSSPGGKSWLRHCCKHHLWLLFLNLDSRQTCKSNKLCSAVFTKCWLLSRHLTASRSLRRRTTRQCRHQHVINTAMSPIGRQTLASVLHHVDLVAGSWASTRATPSSSVRWTETGWRASWTVGSASSPSTMYRWGALRICF